ncbi:MAG: TetR/AcrR family transcriptional regulator [Clostridia bacterium]|nr:TetR/AcrR family transcriptional regulator [Clostridia bacterium]
MKSANFDEGIRERLLIAGIKEIELHGLNDFSLRRVASMCEVSCAAPYRHFKNKDELVLSIISYINSRWDMMCEQIEKAFDGDIGRQIVESCIANVRFLIANPNYLSIMLPIGSGMTDEQMTEREKIWCRIVSLVGKYADDMGYDDEKKSEIEYLLKTLIYGTVVYLEKTDFSNPDKSIAVMRKVLLGIIGQS